MTGNTYNFPHFISLTIARNAISDCTSSCTSTIFIFFSRESIEKPLCL